ncbi:hemerythrin domain-containing protein [Psychroflexus sp. S27]|uniref:hemerythrin domain-containing protein n=1 Tax=Psychroflexus sp. S27 TaxID=1982757 RepID=UPI00269AEBAC
MNIFEAIRKDHDKQRELCKQVTTTSGNIHERKQYWKSLKHELQIHADAEKTCFILTLNR